MARHRWATGPPSRTSHRLPRVLDGGTLPPESVRQGSPQQLPESISTPAEQPPAHRRWVPARRACLVLLGFALTVGFCLLAVKGNDATEVVSVELTSAAEPSDSSTPDGSPDAPPAGADPGTPESLATEGSPAMQGDTLVVHVTGAVKKPGIIETQTGARVFEVLEQAGGALPDADLAAINLAAAVEDGQQIRIPRAGEAPPDPMAPPAAGEPGAGVGGTVNLNTASAEELEALPRVGPVLAARIIEWRAGHGAFSRPEDLDAVPGIGPAMLEALLPLVSV
ncbi:ComEA family DNA-binding protein [Arthrobacter sp. H5]|uniref:ComEA family DNA-binding protein n=1 Tax=Arthrobacter sp. H5 TaxID=1267973 RepID=UPI0006845A48|nr:ComEA family DNA-binding protein [Arthrobacter sp. H5]